MQVWTALSIVLVAVIVAACGESGSAPSTPKSAGPPAPAKPAPQEVRIAAAASLKPALTEIAAEFEKAHAGAKVTLTFGSSGTLYAQLTQLAPFDVFLSADTGYPKKLAETGLSEGGSQVFARGKLMLWENVKDLDLAADGPAGLKKDSVKHIAIANPETAPYGKAAKQALTKLGLWDALQPKLVIGENVEQTAQFLASGAAEAGFLPMSLLAGTDLGNAGGMAPVDAGAYDPIEHALVVMKSAANDPLAAEFAAAVLSAESGAILQKHGLSPAH